MSSVRIERVPVQFLGLGIFGFDHLQLVYERPGLDGELQEDWFVLEGVRDAGVSGSTIGVIGTDGVTTLSEANGGKTGGELSSEIGTPVIRGSREVVGNANALSAWNTMATFGADLDAQRLPYVGLSAGLIAVPIITSSSVASTLLYHVGIDIAQVMPAGMGFSPGWRTLLGTSGSDTLSIGGSFDTILGGAGNDTLSGSNSTSTIDRLHGGFGDDTFTWSEGDNVYHGGQIGLDYSKDGIDTVDYSGVGTVRIEFNADYIPHKTATFYAYHGTGTDRLLSIEAIEWDTESDTIEVGEGVHLIDDSIKLKLGGEDAAGQGDKISFSNSNSALIVNAAADGSLVVQEVGKSLADRGLYFESAEWFQGSKAGDSIYLTPTLRGAEGGEGDDILDARLAMPFSGLSPSGYDAELIGGAGNDTIVSGAGRTLATGGSGSDRFVVSTITPFEATSPIEFVIEDATLDDRLFVTYGPFANVITDFDTSPLMPLLGAMAQIPGAASFADLPQNLGPWKSSSGARSDYFAFEWQLQQDIHFGSDQTNGVIDFIGNIFYNRDGADLLIHIFFGTPFTIVEEGNDGEPWEHTVNLSFPETETIVRVKNFAEGDLGIVFYDPGTPTVIDVETDHGTYSVFDYPNWDAAVLAMTAGGVMETPLPVRPDAPQYVPATPPAGQEPTLISGTGGDDVIVASAGAAEINAGAGNDSIEGDNGDDLIDGGSGDDQMTGGAGHDTYVVDAAGDVVIETAGGGRDLVVATVSTVLSDHVENLELSGGAVSGTGNALDNRITGTGGGNILLGLGGNDVLFGGQGNDNLDGGEGSDRFIYALGDGDDLIRDTGLEADVNTLSLLGIAAQDVSLFRLAPTPSHLVLGLPDGARITIENYFATGGAGIDRVVFELGAIWEADELDARATAAPILINDQPQSQDDYGLGVSSGTVVIPASALLANDRDADGGTLTIVSLSDVSAGADATITANGDVALSTPPGFEGIVRFRYMASDGQGGTSSAFAEICVFPNLAPVVSGIIPDQTSPEDEPWSYVLPPGLFADPEGEILTRSARLSGGAALPAWLSFDGETGTFSGTPPQNFSGALAIEVTASDGLVDSSAVFTFVVTPVNDAPAVVADGVFEAETGTPLTIAAVALLANDSDVEGDTLSIVSVQDAMNGTVVLDALGNAVFTPAAGYQGPAAFTYTASDGNGGISTAGVAINVGGGAGGLVIIGTALAEALTGSGGNDTIEGRGGNDFLSGLGGDDTFLVAGFDGLDTFDGGAGYDRIAGGAGNDVIGLLNGSSSLLSVEEIDGGTGFDVLRLGGGDDLLDLSIITVNGLEEIRALAGNDIIFGSASDDAINGGGGNDSLSGGAGNDTFLVVTANGLDMFDGGAGFDQVTGSSGNDTIGLLSGSASLADIEMLDGGAGFDILRLSSQSDILDLSLLTVREIEEIRGLGGNDQITGTASGDKISGGAGNDVLAGEAGDDSFLVTGNGGSDSYDGGAGFDKIEGGTGNDTIGLIQGSQSLIGIEAIDGGDGTDTLRLTAGDDVLDLSGLSVSGIELVSALAGNDIIIASAADDVIRGGSGSDTFIFKAGTGNDIILDFQRGTLANPSIDVIDLTDYGFADFAALMAVVALDGADAVISLGADSSLRITGIAPAQLRSDDFLLV
jgi:Ca2+-binding RTX toxin-like protein